MLKDPFGTIQGDSVWWDNEIQEDIDEIYCKVEYALDQIPGHSADMMWLDRFSSLYTDTDALRNGDSDYFCEQERLRLANVHSRDNRYDSIKRRWHAVRAFNPLSSKMSRLRNSDHVRDEYSPFNIILEHRWNKRE
jgi:hypothetical protein